MNRNTLLFICLCLGAGFLLVRFHRPAANPGAASSGAAVQPVENPAATGMAVEPAVETVLAQTAPDSAVAAVRETELPGLPAAVENPPAVEKDKYELLRELRAWAARDPEAALAATLDLTEGEE